MTHFDVPYDSLLQTLNDHQTDVNSFLNLAYRHRFGEAVGTDEQASRPSCSSGRTSAMVH